MKKWMLQKELTLIKLEDQKYMSCHYWYLKDVGYKFEPSVCNVCHILMAAYE